MTKDDPTGDRTAALPEENPAGPRKSRTIRFSDSEWKQVEAAAKQRAMATAEFVRGAALGVAASDPSRDSVKLPPDIVALIESTYRYAYIVATLKRNELVRDGHGPEVDKVVKLARDTQSRVLSESR